MLDLQRYFVKENAGIFKSKGTFEIINPDTKERVGIARETTAGFGAVLKGLMGKDKGPMKISITESEKGPPVVEITRSWSVMAGPKIHVHEKGKHLGFFKKKSFSMTGGLNVFDGAGKKVGEVQGSWKGGTFTFKGSEGATLGEISKKPVGTFKAMFTSADNYMVIVGEGQPASTGVLLLAAAIVLDKLYYDGKKGGEVAGGGGDDE
jgi:hypothetical protein